MSETIEVTEKMARFIEWARGVGEDEIRKRIRERLVALRDMPKHMRDKDGLYWDVRLEPNDDDDQYRNGGDCNLCKRKDYCAKQCGANRELKKVVTPFLYQMYLDENPEAEMAEAAERITPEDVLKMVGADDGQKLLF